MLNRKEILNIIVITIVLAISISMFNIKELFFSTLLIIFIIIMLNVFSKKITSYYLGVKMNLKMWEIRQWGIQKHFRFKKPINLGILVPIILKVVSLGYLNFTASLTYDVEAKVYRAAKKHGIYSFTEISETQIGAIAAVGIGVNIIFCIIGYLVGFPEFARISLGFAFWNLLPISNLDGNKIFFGSITLWSFLMLLVLIGLFLSIFVI